MTTARNHTCNNTVGAGLASQPCLACSENFAETGNRFLSADARDAIRVDPITVDIWPCANCAGAVASLARDLVTARDTNWKLHRRAQKEEGAAARLYGLRARLEADLARHFKWNRQKRAELRIRLGAITKMLIEAGVPDYFEMPDGSHHPNAVTRDPKILTERLIAMHKKASRLSLWRRLFNTTP